MARSYTMDEFLKNYDSLMRAIFYSEEFDDLLFFFDYLIDEKRISHDSFQETNLLVNFISENIENHDKCVSQFNNQLTAIKLDFYYRYQRLARGLSNDSFIPVNAETPSEIFIELFNASYHMYNIK